MESLTSLFLGKLMGIGAQKYSWEFQILAKEIHEETILLSTK